MVVVPAKSAKCKARSYTSDTTDSLPSSDKHWLEASAARSRWSKPRGQFAGYGQGSPDFVYRNARNKLVFTDVSVIAARGNANRQHLMTKSR